MYPGGKFLANLAREKKFCPAIGYVRGWEGFNPASAANSA